MPYPYPDFVVGKSSADRSISFVLKLEGPHHRAAYPVAQQCDTKVSAPKEVFHPNEAGSEMLKQERLFFKPSSFKHTAVHFESQEYDTRRR